MSLTNGTTNSDHLQVACEARFHRQTTSPATRPTESLTRLHLLLKHRVGTALERVNIGVLSMDCQATVGHEIQISATGLAGHRGMFVWSWSTRVARRKSLSAVMYPVKLTQLHQVHACTTRRSSPCESRWTLSKGHRARELAPSTRKRRRRTSCPTRRDTSP